MAVFIDGLKRIDKRGSGGSRTQSVFNSLTIAPTTMHLDIAQEIEDYSLKVGMMVIGV